MVFQMLDDKRLGDLSGITRFGDSCGGATHTLQISQHESNHKSDCVAYTLGCTKKSERNQREIREKSERNQREIREKSERNQREIREKSETNTETNTENPENSENSDLESNCVAYTFSRNS